MDREEEIEFQKIEDLKAVVNLPAGKRFLHRLLDEAGFRSKSFTNNGWTAYNLGRKSIADTLFERLTEAGQEYMIKVIYAATDDHVLQHELKENEE